LTTLDRFDAADENDVGENNDDDGDDRVKLKMVDDTDTSRARTRVEPVRQRQRVIGLTGARRRSVRQILRVEDEPVDLDYRRSLTIARHDRQSNTNAMKKRRARLVARATHLCAMFTLVRRRRQEKEICPG
jgi:hypothetical protein